MTRNAEIAQTVADVAALMFSSGTYEPGRDVATVLASVPTPEAWTDEHMLRDMEIAEDLTDRWCD